MERMGGSEDAGMRAVHVASQRPPVFASKSTGPLVLKDVLGRLVKIVVSAALVETAQASNKIRQTGITGTDSWRHVQEGLVPFYAIQGLIISLRNEVKTVMG